MQVFYAPGISGDRWFLDEKESRHCIRVLRMKAGSPVRLIDGKGNLYEGSVIKPDPDACEIGISKVIKDFDRRDYYLHMAVSPLKNPERFEWLVEKIVEIGVDEITPLICSNSEKKTIRTERVNGIIISAMKQSLKAYRTKLNEPVMFGNLIGNPPAGISMIAHCSPNQPARLVSSVYRQGSTATMLIGPEGDFTDSEIRTAMDSGFMPVTLGKSRLRTETAGLVACHSIHFMNQV